MDYKGNNEEIVQQTDDKRENNKHWSFSATNW